MVLDATPRAAPFVDHGLEITGFQPFSTVDWPGRLAATVFLQGCPWRCTYCHNPDLQDPRTPGTVRWSDVIAHMESRRGQLDGLVFSGGEPTRQVTLPDAMRDIHDRGFGVGLHSAGIYPTRLADALPYTDWLGLDIKATVDQYVEIAQVGLAGERAWRSLDVALEWGGPLEVRITVDPTVHTRDDVLELREELRARGVTSPVIQRAQSRGATEEYAKALGSLRLTDVVNPSDIEGLVVR